MSILSLFLTAAAAWATPLAGVENEETTIRTAITQQVPHGGDVLFVRDSIGRWYRVELSAGCLEQTADVHTVAFRTQPVTGIIDRFSSVAVGRTGRVCGIESVRRSAAPPQRDSRSPIARD